jgi:hypothetical protein
MTTAKTKTTTPAKTAKAPTAPAATSDKASAPPAATKATPTKAATAKPAAAKPVAKPVAAKSATAKPAAAPAKKPAPRAPSKEAAALAEINAKNQKALSEALVKAKALKIPQPVGLPLPPPELPGKAKKAAKAKPVKAKKAKLVRDSYAMPENEYARIGGLKKRLAALGKDVKKSELLRAGIAYLAELQDNALEAAVAKIERIKTGRPANSK